MTSASEPAQPGTEGGNMTEDQKRQAAHERAAHTRQKQSLSLQRELILSQRTSNPGRRAALESALKEIEAQLDALD